MKNSKSKSINPKKDLSLSLVRSLEALDNKEVLMPELDLKSSCLYYQVLRDPKSKKVLFVQPFIRYKDNDLL